MPDVTSKVADDLWSVFLLYAKNENRDSVEVRKKAEELIATVATSPSYILWPSVFLVPREPGEYAHMWQLLVVDRDVGWDKLELTPDEKQRLGTPANQALVSESTLFSFVGYIRKAPLVPRSERAQFWVNTLAFWGNIHAVRGKFFPHRAEDPVAPSLPDPQLSLASVLGRLFGEAPAPPVVASSTDAVAKGDDHDAALTALLQKMSMLEGPEAQDAIHKMTSYEWGVNNDNDAGAAAAALVYAQRLHPDDFVLAQAAEKYTTTLPADL